MNALGLNHICMLTHAPMKFSWLSAIASELDLHVFFYLILHERLAFTEQRTNIVLRQMCLTPTHVYLEFLQILKAEFHPI